MFPGNLRHERPVSYFAEIERNVWVNRGAMPSREVVEHHNLLALRPEKIHSHAADIARTASHKNRHLSPVRCLISQRYPAAVCNCPWIVPVTSLWSLTNMHNANE